MNIKKKFLTITIVLSVVLPVTVAFCYLLFPQPVQPTQVSTLPKFASCQEFVEAFKKGEEKAALGRGGYGVLPFAPLLSPQAMKEAAETPEYSTTNIQVEGVDEADIVKNDGEYIYTISENKIIICKAYPPSESKILSKINFENDLEVQELFIGKNRLVAIGSKYSKENYSSLAFVKIWDTTDKSNPEVKREIEFEGSYSTSRKIEDYVYLVLNSHPNYKLYEKDEIEAEEIIPKYKDTKGSEKVEDLKPACKCTDIQYFDPDSFTRFLSILSIPVENDKKEIKKEIIAGFSENVYASLDNLYVTSTKYDYTISPQSTADEDEKTDIYKFALDGENIAYQGTSSVPGTVLNQFSMDEYNGYFRIATTRGHVGSEDSTATNNVYILDSGLKEVGKIENIAPGEKIYSARFMGKKGYLVTFKKVDPFFTLDLADPKNPKILGKLKIPGYSDYLHPYDENHIIGIGKNTQEATEEERAGRDFAWYQGIKMALFDVSDFKNPKEMYKVEIGDRGTDSYALQDHKAFLFDKDKNLLVIPILLAEIPEDKKVQAASNEYGDYTYQGAYVYNLSLEKGFEFKDRITHKQDSFKEERDYYYYDDIEAVKRSLYIGDFLYTISQAKVMINNLDDLERVNEIKFE